MKPEPQKKFPQVSSCHRAPIKTPKPYISSKIHQCTQCLQPCDAIADEGLGEKKSHCCGKAIKPKAIIVQGESSFQCDECHDDVCKCGALPYIEVGNRATQYENCTCKKPLPPPDAKEEKGVIEQIIEKAIEGGWNELPKGQKIQVEIWEGNHYVYAGGAEICLEMYLLNPLFWQALGKKMGWKEVKNESLSKTDDFGGFYYLQEWLKHWHRFIDHLAEGKDIESFFIQFLNPHDQT